MKKINKRKFWTKYFEGNEEFLKFLIEKYPIKQYNKNYDIIGEYRKNKKNLWRKLVSSYKNYKQNSLNMLENNIDSTFIKDIILEYQGNIKNMPNSLCKILLINFKKK